VALVRYRPSRRGIRELLGSPEVLADLVARAERVAAAAEASYAARPPHEGEVRVEVDGQLPPERHTRARAAVIAQHPAALHIEADRRPLGSALDAAG
jgi:hypothetical protein